MYISPSGCLASATPTPCIISGLLDVLLLLFIPPTAYPHNVTKGIYHFLKLKLERPGERSGLRYRDDLEHQVSRSLGISIF